MLQRGLKGTLKASVQDLQDLPFSLVVDVESFKSFKGMWEGNTPDTSLSKKTIASQSWWGMFVSLALRRLRQKDHPQCKAIWATWQVRGQFELHRQTLLTTPQNKINKNSLLCVRGNMGLVHFSHG